MSTSDFRSASPYTPTPGSSTPPPTVKAEEGTRDLWTFFWLAIANSAIIIGAGLAAWLYVH
ncbi:MAG: hypothetical protein WCA77_00995 [Thermoplasmata archaeon]